MNLLAQRVGRTAPVLLLLSALSLLVGCEQYAGDVVNAYDKSKNLKVAGDLKATAAVITSYLTGEGNLPEADDIDGLREILQPDYTRRLATVDPWGNKYDFWTDGREYVLSSSGLDGEWDTEDDIEVSDGQLTMMPTGPASKL
jgi:hypothetical protein